jgi:hypothetical protein
LTAQSREQTWILLTNSHFEILSDGKQDHAVKAARELERFRAGYLSLMGPSGHANDPPTRVIMFSSVREQAKYFPNRNLAAFVIRWEATSILTMAVDYRTLSEEYVARHEYVHALSHRTPGRRPRWFEEGIAEVLGISRIDLVKNEFQFGLPNDRMRARRRQDYPRLNERLLEDFPGKVWMRGDPYWYYWLLTHYLTLGSEWRNAQFRNYLDLYDNGVAHDVAFRQAFGVSPRELWDQEIIPYMGSVPSFTVKLRVEEIDDQFTIVPAPKSMLEETLNALRANR